MERIQTRAQLKALARRLRVRPDWHEPDEQGVSADVFGRSFDNAGFWPMSRGDEHGLGIPEKSLEMYVAIYQGHDMDSTDPDPELVATVNLATLLAWACGLEDE